MLNLQQLQPYKELAKSNVLLPIGWGDDKKAPMLSKWQLHKGFTVEELAKINNAYAVGLRLDKVFCADIDGETAVRWARFKGLLTQPATWEVHRDTSPYHFKRFFIPDSKQIEQLPENQYGLQEFQFKVKTSKWNQSNDAVEFFLTHQRQCIIAGKHFKSGGEYYSSESFGIDKLRKPTDKEWQIILEEVYKHQEKNINPTGAKSLGKDWIRLASCPICGRNSHSICSIHKDEQTIRCFHGNSFSPESNLAVGEVITSDWGDQWAFCRFKDEPAIGTFSIYTKHKPTPTQLNFRRWRNV